MIIELNRQIIDHLNKEGVGLESYILLLAIEGKEEIFDETIKEHYLLATNLIVRGLLCEDFSDSDYLYYLSYKGERFLEDINKLKENE